MTASRGAWLISTDLSRFDLDRAHRWLSEQSYWAAGRSRAVFDAAVRNSLCVGAFTREGVQVGFARLVTDRATFAWLADVFVDDAYRGRGVSSAMLEAIIAHPDLATVKRILLATRDAHGLYKRYGFEPVDAERMMQRVNPAARTPAEISS